MKYPQLGRYQPAVGLVEALALDKPCHAGYDCAASQQVMSRPNIVKFKTRGQRKSRYKRTAVMAGGAFLASLGVGIASLWIWPASPAGSPAPISEDAIQSLMADLSLEANDARKLLEERGRLKDPQQPHLALCGQGQRVSCVVDGDTIWLRGEKIRVADIDTPEVSEPQCEAEYQLGVQTTYRLRDLLNEGPFKVTPVLSRDEDQYGRKLRILTRNTQSIGDMLVAEGLARTWTGRREPWC